MLLVAEANDGEHLVDLRLVEVLLERGKEAQVLESICLIFGFD